MVEFIIYKANGQKRALKIDMLTNTEVRSYYNGAKSSLQSCFIGPSPDLWWGDVFERSSEALLLLTPEMEKRGLL